MFVCLLDISLLVHSLFSFSSAMSGVQATACRRMGNLTDVSVPKIATCRKQITQFTIFLFSCFGVLLFLLLFYYIILIALICDWCVCVCVCVCVYACACVCKSLCVVMCVHSCCMR